MRVLAAFPVFPGAAYDGSSVYERRLLAALRDLGVQIEIVAARSTGFSPAGLADLRWRHDAHRRERVEGFDVRRHSAWPSKAGRLASRSVVRRWAEEDLYGGQVVDGSANALATRFARSARRPRWLDLAVDLGRGPVVPGMVLDVLRRAPKADVVLTGYLPFSLPAQVVWAAQRVGTPAVVLPFFHDADSTHFIGGGLKTLRAADAVLTLGEHSSAILESHLPESRPLALGAGATVIPPLDPQRAAEAFRQRHELADRPMFLIVGRKESSKRYDLALAALAAAPEDAVLVMVGPDADGVKMTDRRVLQLGVVGPTELAAAHAAADVLLFGSEHESFGLVLIDAWQAGVPVVVNGDCAASRSLVRDEIDGIVACGKAAFVAGALRLLQDPPLRSAMGAAGRDRVAREFTWPRVAERALSLFERLSERNG